ncbi:MAG: Rpn family recombination-promoting nuclease/putative transposase [Desulforegulaceae bacterium]|nr:Rpn family recombination-promoting nuclease/putative transposase [Desulforegulaceae bacterium]
MNDFNIKNSHDKLFKDTWSDLNNAESFLKNYLPKKVFDLTDLDSLLS